ncbi:MAG: polysaccharide biosynthesis protein [Devosia sp.]
MMTVIFGSQGNVAQKLRTIFPDSFGVDQVEGADLVTSMQDADYDAEPLRSRLAEADLVLHLATSPRVDDPDEVHYQAVIDAARLLQACQKIPVPRVLLPSSDWADPKRGWPPVNTYGHSKRVFETMATMYRYSTGKICVALRFGWVAHNRAEAEAAEPKWLRDNYWDEERLFREVRRALDL